MQKDPSISLSTYKQHQKGVLHDREKEKITKRKKKEEERIFHHIKKVRHHQGQDSGQERSNPHLKKKLQLLCRCF